jgi:hypothetical protein
MWSLMNLKIYRFSIWEVLIVGYDMCLFIGVIVCVHVCEHPRLYYDSNIEKRVDT